MVMMKVDVDGGELALGGGEGDEDEMKEKGRRSKMDVRF